MGASAWTRKAAHLAARILESGSTPVAPSATRRSSSVVARARPWRRRSPRCRPRPSWREPRERRPPSGRSRCWCRCSDTTTPAASRSASEARRASRHVAPIARVPIEERCHVISKVAESQRRGRASSSMAQRTLSRNDNSAAMLHTQLSHSRSIDRSIAESISRSVGWKREQRAQVEGSGGCGEADPIRQRAREMQRAAGSKATTPQPPLLPLPLPHHC